MLPLADTFGDTVANDLLRPSATQADTVCPPPKPARPSAADREHCPPQLVVRKGAAPCSLQAVGLCDCGLELGKVGGKDPIFPIDAG
jgi:hypothetical protein